MMKQNKRLLAVKRYLALLVGLVMLGATIAGATAWSLGELKEQAQQKLEDFTESVEEYQEKFETQSQEQHEKQHQDKEQSQKQLSDNEVVEALRLANNDKYTTDFLKASFAEDNFCLETEARFECFRVLEDGTIIILNEKPEKYFKMTTTEAYLASAWQRFMDGERIDSKEMKKHVDIPFRAKMKMAWAKILT